MTAIVVPFRGSTGKRRLAPLPPERRRGLSLAMLEDVLDACTATGDAVVVTSDEDARALAGDLEAQAVDDPGGGQGEAVAAALAGVRATLVLVVNADLPCVRISDLRRLELATPPDGIALVEASDGTTNALGLASPELFSPLYGPGSADRFRLHAAQLGVDLVEASIPNLADDVDELADLERLGARVGPSTRVAAALLRAEVTA